MRCYISNRLRDIAWGQILPYMWEDGMIGLEDLSVCIELLGGAFGTPTD
jgi:hypothetical protein